MPNIVIKTSEVQWFTKLVQAYRNKEAITLIDDMNVGIDPGSQNLVQMGLKAKLSKEEWIAVVVSLGISAAGIGCVVAAILDPEPTSKLGLLIGGGIAILASGGFTATYILTKIKPPNIKIGPANWIDIS
jgi:hypothetical protein